MKKLILLSGLWLVLASCPVAAQDSFQEDYRGLNILLNLGTIYAVNVSYEIALPHQITVAPVSLIDFDGNFGLGAKGTYYFDKLFNLIDPLDVYAGLDLGYRFKSEDFAVGIFVGAEWHFTEKAGLILELGGGNLAFGIGIGVGIHF